MVSIFKLSAFTLNTFCRKFERILPGTGICALLQRVNSVKITSPDILPGQLNSSAFN
jgi:hypothetical protein